MNLITILGAAIKAAKTYTDSVALGQGAIQGPAGPKGEPGIQGPQGIQGEQGIPGSKGLSGADGMRGPAGPQGEAGPRGLAGPQGDTGERGLAGETPSEGALIALIEAAAENMKLTVPFIPDYSAIETVAVINEDGGEWSADKDGFVYVETGAKSADSGWLRPNVWINDVRVAWNLHSSTLDTEHRIRASVLLPIGTGDTIKVEVRRTDGVLVTDSFYVTVRFIPPRGLVLSTGERGPQGVAGPAGRDGTDGKDGASVDIQEVVAAVLKALPPGLAVMNDAGELLTLTTIGELNLGDE